MLSRALEPILNDAFRNATSEPHEFITVEHLLLGLLMQEASDEILKATGADIDELRCALVTHIDATVPKLPDVADRETGPTLGFQRVYNGLYSMSKDRAAKRLAGVVCSSQSSATKIVKLFPFSMSKALPAKVA
jgi:ATP-dependent Clp protease ATP-binding subunit ClpA